MTYEGVCRGGPYDGQWLAHYNKQFCVAQQAPLTARIDPNSAPPDHIEIKYSYYHYVLAQWIWRE